LRAAPSGRKNRIAPHMITSIDLNRRAILGRAVFILAGCTFSLALAQTSTLRAAPAAPAAASTEKAHALPLTATFAKVKGAEGAPYVLTLKNVSNETVKAKAKILLSVAFHADSKARNLPEHAIDAGKEWTISELAAADKVIVTADGFEPLELTVP
jgi:hypothetical protein